MLPSSQSTANENAERPRNSDKNDALVSSDSTCIFLGTIALATYWAWIFSIFHSAVLDPFSPREVYPYLMLCVISAGSSALSLAAFALFSYRSHRIVDKNWFATLLVASSASMGIPALMSQLGTNVSFPFAALFWIVGAAASSFIFLKTGPFLVWLDRRKLMRCIALSFLLASLLLLLVISLYPLAGVATVMLLPAISTFCSHFVNSKTGGGIPDEIADTFNDHLKNLSSQIGGLSHSILRTILYAFVFGVTSYTVLNLAIEQRLVVLIGLPILVSAVAFTVYVFSKKVEVDSERYRTFLLPFIAVATLPFPYLPDVYNIAFLAIIVFGFTCYDAISWGDLADEIRDRQLPAYISYATPTVGNFVGIFIGWGTGALMHAVLGEEGYGSGFSVFSIAAVIVLVVMLTYDLAKREREEAAESHADAYLDNWKEACSKIADASNLTNQERRIYLMLARGRNRRYIANELFISPHTVKTHAAHIYKKTGVHSQQELIDMVESKR